MTLNEVLSLHSPPAVKEYTLNHDDFKKLFWKYKGLLLDLQRNNVFWSATNENLKTAYEKLDIQEQELERAYNLNKKYLDNITEGLLLIDKNLIILDQYSKYMSRLFLTDKIKGCNILDFLYPDKKVFQKERKELGKYIAILFSKTLASPEIIQEINPMVDKTIFIKRNNKTIEKVVNAKFIRIYNKEVIEHIMIIFEDKTREIHMKKQLEKEKSKYKAEIESILAILRSGPDAFFDFINESSSIFENIKQHINELEDIKLRNEFFRQIHSLKGTAKYFELNHIAQLAHALEDIFSEWDKEDTIKIKSIKEKILKMVDHIWNEFRTIDKTNTRLLKFYERAALHGSCSRDGKLDNFIVSLKRMTENLSKEQGKEIQLSIKKEIDKLPCLNKLKNPIIQILRNAIYHGIEDSFERLSLSKKQKGNIILHLFKTDNDYVIEISDDGRGINFDTIQKKAMDKHLIRNCDKIISKEELIQILFSPNFSSTDMVSQLSGRGYGLDIVKSSMCELHGKVSVATRERKGTKFILKIPETGKVKKRVK
ncbi:MAG: Hpt domain-containing protein [Spirochaetales bacterium]|nr:Hpt domain-containing protein [Spirochaetales bacterium]